MGDRHRKREGARSEPHCRGKRAAFLHRQQHGMAEGQHHRRNGAERALSPPRYQSTPFPAISHLNGASGGESAKVVLRGRLRQQLTSRRFPTVRAPASTGYCPEPPALRAAALHAKPGALLEATLLAAARPKPARETSLVRPRETPQGSAAAPSGRRAEQPAPARTASTPRRPA
jgi:hypothetical protein